ncbi:MAG: translation initiation factor [Bacteroidetes bacterium]|nr:translation initiation factor [Bacteroidota bacterium]
MHEEDYNLVYSTNPEQQKGGDSSTGNLNLKIFLDKKAKGGKVTTVITGFIGPGKERSILASQLKKKCSTGGTVKNGDIILQGDFTKRAEEFLVENGYRVKIK